MLIENNNIQYYFDIFISSNIHFLHLIKEGKRSARLTNIEKQQLTLIPIQQEITVGCLLGDASLERNSPTNNSRLIFDQTFLSHAEYIMFLYSHFYFLTRSKGPKVNIRQPDIRTNKVFSSIAFKTLSLPCFNFYHDLFYSLELGKIIPLNISDFLTPRALAFWIMNDSSKDFNNQTILHTRSYSYNNILVL